MCCTCTLLLLDACPPALAVRETDFDEDLADEQELQTRLEPAPRTPPTFDGITERVLRARLLRTQPPVALP